MALSVTLRFSVDLSGVFETKESGGGGDLAHAVGGNTGVRAQATGAVLATHQPVDVARLQLQAILVPGEGGLRHPDHFALQVHCTFLGQHRLEGLEEARFLVVLRHRHCEEATSVKSVASVLGHHPPLPLVLQGGLGDVAVVEAAVLLAQQHSVAAPQRCVTVSPGHLQAGAVGHLWWNKVGKPRQLDSALVTRQK